MTKCMHRIAAFAGRVALEIIRDPLSYIFALGFPLIMLLIMTVVNASIPPEAETSLNTVTALLPNSISASTLCPVLPEVRYVL